MTPDAHIRRIAQRQRGHVTGEQVRASGLSEKQIHVRKKRGELARVLPGVFRLGGVPETFEGRLTAVDLWMGGDGFFNAATAAYLLRLDGIEQPVCLSVARHSGITANPWLKVCRLGVNDVPTTRWVGGFRICHVERAIAECVATLPARRAGRALDDALRRRLTTLHRMQCFARDWGRGRRGAKVLRQLLLGRDHQDEQVRSIFESKTLAILRRIPELQFVPNYEVHAHGHTYFLDFYVPTAKLGIECQSFRWHMGQHNADARRDRRIGSVGIEIVYFTWDDVCFHADEVEHDTRAAVARRIAFYSA